MRIHPVIAGMEALDGTPIVDIKPMVASESGDR